ELGMDDKTIAAALLHDVVEDCAVDCQRIRAEFGDEVAELVEGVTKLRRIDFNTRQDQQAENLRKMFMAMARDIRVIIIKLADRLHNLRTLDPFPPERQEEKAQETLQIFAPLAHRLGIWHLKWELEDLSFRYTNAEIYWDMVRKVKKTREQRVHEVDQAIAALASKLKEEGVEAEIQGRPKHLYSIYNKMLRDEIDFDSIYDLTAIRVVCGSVGSCYHALGAVHNLWMPIPNMYTDYIAKPKSNGYQSLHTKVYGSSGEPMEVQIRTWAMHRESEFGIAAHWKYKESGDTVNSQNYEQNVRWIRQLLELQHDHPNAHEYLESLKVDLYEDQVFVFTPAGDVVDLPASSTPVDFAYRVHTEVGHRCIGAKANGHIVPLDYRLQNGDIVEILTQRTSKGPSRDWLDFVQTPHARNRIKSFLRKIAFEDNLRFGRERLEKEVHSLRLDPGQILRPEILDQISQGTNFKGADNLIAAVGYGDLSAESIVEKARSLALGKDDSMRQLPRALETAVAKRKRAERQQGRLKFGITASDIDDVMYRLSRCCSPIPGDKVVGYVTRGRGVAVHRTDCRNILYYSQKDPERLMEIEWSLEDGGTYQAEIHVEAFDRVGLLNDITSIITERKMNIDSADVQTRKDHMAQINLVLSIGDRQHLENLIGDIQGLTDVTRVYRITG
ncbi:MAG: bifunctional (p)ppGpp synthetase/guanosine-3',5'-bis(diphosphate) 3'-pyrophosphohydrolase, partial [Armatimonadetes bacterium]|nr:bifunctional (p)ppGpp synthetase/guanosine-3',5'-bis(diphosphate) 3'-pyrophosphohydrolase [Armatimonadota bacterium]